MFEDKFLTIEQAVGKTVKQVHSNYDFACLAFTDGTFLYIQTDYESSDIRFGDQPSEHELSKYVELGLMSQQESDVIRGEKKKLYDSFTAEQERQQYLRLKEKYG